MTIKQLWKQNHFLIKGNISCINRGLKNIKKLSKNEWKIRSIIYLITLFYKVSERQWKLKGKGQLDFTRFFYLFLHFP